MIFDTKTHGTTEQLMRQAAEELAAADSVMAGLIGRIGPCQLGLPKRNHYFASLVETIIYQQLAGKAAAAILARFRALYPGRRFPSAEMIHATPDERLRSAGLSPQKISYIRDLCSRVLDGSLPLRRISSMQDEEVILHLTLVKGIGRWTSEMFLIFCLRRPDILPMNDLGILNAVRKAYGFRRIPSAELWKDWAGSGSLIAPWPPGICGRAWIRKMRNCRNNPRNHGVIQSLRDQKHFSQRRKAAKVREEGREVGLCGSLRLCGFARDLYFPHSWAASYLACLIAAALLSSAAVRADTIFLKNGRRIIAGQVSEEGDQVLYDGEHGRVSLPKSLVDRVQKDDAVPAPESNVSQAPPADPIPSPTPRPAASDSRVINFARAMSFEIQLPQKDINGVVRDGAVDEDRLNLLAGMASKGDLELQSAVNAYLVAAIFENSKQHVAQASRWAEEALRLSGQDWNALLLASQLDLERQQYTEALNHLFLAQSLKPDSPEVLKQLGFAYYFLEGPEKANRYWKQSYTLKPDPRLQELIRQTEKEAQVEGGFIQAQSSHFVLNREGAAISESFSGQILETLEQHYSDLEAALDFAPRESMVVILYPAQEFTDLTRAPGWAGALNDGKIRVPVQGLTSMTPTLSAVLKHEMVHSFVHGLVQSNCPTWFNEGLAQVEAGQRPAVPPATLAAIYAQSKQIPLQQLEGSFLHFDNDTAAVAYAESQAAVAMIRDQQGAYALAEVLKSLAQGQTMPQTLRRLFGVDYAGFEANLASYVAGR